MPPVVDLDAAGDEDHAGAGGGPDGQGYRQQHQQELLVQPFTQLLFSPGLPQ